MDQKTRQSRVGLWIGTQRFNGTTLCGRALEEPAAQIRTRGRAGGPPGPGGPSLAQPTRLAARPRRASGVPVALPTGRQPWVGGGRIPRGPASGLLRRPRFCYTRQLTRSVQYAGSPRSDFEPRCASRSARSLGIHLGESVLGAVRTVPLSGPPLALGYPWLGRSSATSRQFRSMPLPPALWPS